MTRPIFYYVHHQGRGHLDRALAIADQAPNRFVLLGTGIAGHTGSVPAIELDDDRPTSLSPQEAATAPALHYAPLDHAGIRRRVATLATAFAGLAPALIVVDVSVEVALLAAIASIPMIYLRLSGDRTDPAHANIFQAARQLIAPFHRDLEDPTIPRWIAAKTRYCPGLTTARPHERIDHNVVLVVAGSGGLVFDGERIAAASRAAPAYRWICIGPVSTPSAMPDNLVIKGWSANPERDIAGARVVVGAAGDGLVSAVLAVNRPFICIPEDRPYREQHLKAAALERVGAAIVVPDWPSPAHWRDLLDRALGLDPAVMVRLHDPAGAEHMAGHLIGMARSA